MRTADSIEENNAQRESSQQATKQRKKRTSAHLVKFRWVKGQSGNPGGRIKNDFAASFARRVLEAIGNEELLERYAAGFAQQLVKGNAYTFKELAERGYGKLTEKVEHSVSEELVSRLASARTRKNGSTSDRS
jgi:hypothetical protein